MSSQYNIYSWFFSVVVISLSLVQSENNKLIFLFKSSLTASLLRNNVSISPSIFLRIKVRVYAYKLKSFIFKPLPNKCTLCRLSLDLPGKYLFFYSILYKLGMCGDTLHWHTCTFIFSSKFTQRQQRNLTATKGKQMVCTVGFMWRGFLSVGLGVL